MSEKKQKKVLGRGLDALLGDTDNLDLSIEKKKIINSLQLSLNKIHVNPNQPRTNFDSKEIDNLVKQVKSDINKDAKVVVFHDAYQYFEKRFNVNVLGAFTVNTDVMPGAEQLAEIREIIEHDKVSCIFSEPQFNPDIIKAVAKDMNIQTGVIDPLGATLNPGKDLYFDLIGHMSKSFKCC